VDAHRGRADDGLITRRSDGGHVGDGLGQDGGGSAAGNVGDGGGVGDGDGRGGAEHARPGQGWEYGKVGRASRGAKGTRHIDQSFCKGVAKGKHHVQRSSGVADADGVGDALAIIGRGRRDGLV